MLVYGFLSNLRIIFSVNHDFRHFPARIKVIITAESDSAALTYFEKIGCEVITIESEPLIPSTLTSNLLNRPSYIVIIES